MKTITLSIDPVAVPAGAVCRIYHRDSNEYLGETISDGSGTIVVFVPDEVIEEFYAEVAIEGVDGTSEPIITRVAVE
jgi:hypothetical protein